MAGLISLFRSMPPWLKAIVVGTGLFALSRPEFRSWIIDRGKAGLRASTPVLRNGFDLASKLGSEALEKAREAQVELEGIDESLHQLVPLRIYLRVVCLMEQKPLLADELSQKVIAKGYRSRNKDFEHYVTRVLRSTDGFVEMEGKWTVTALRACV